MTASAKLLPILLIAFGGGLLLDGLGLLGATFVPAIVIAGLGLGVLALFGWNQVTAVVGPWLLGAAACNALRTAALLTGNATMGIEFMLLGGLILLAPKIAPPLEPPSRAAIGESERVGLAND